MDESAGKEGPKEAAVEGAVSEGSADDGGKPAGNPSSRDSVQTLRAEPSSSPGISLNNFDMLASLREAELFALELKKFADQIPDPRWQAISKGMDIVIEAHDSFNKSMVKS